MENIFFNAHHAPIGAFSSFTLGFKGANGGLGRGLDRPAGTNVYLGLESPSGKVVQLFPFYKGGTDDSERYDPDSDKGASGIKTHPFEEKSIKRSFNAAVDIWKADDLKVSIYSQVRSIPDPDTADDEALKEVLVPAILVEITVDNTAGLQPRRAYFGYDGSDPYDNMRRFDNVEDVMAGIGQGTRTAVFCDKGAAQPAISFNLDWILNTISKDNWQFGLGNTGALVMEAPAGQKAVFKFAVCFYHQGNATYGMESVYYYTKYFKSLESVGLYALAHFDAIKGKCLESAKAFDDPALTDDQRFMLAHTIRSYYGSTQFLAQEGKPIWIVNEGEYRMMNTLDLTVDQLFYEMRMNPWTTRNVLDLFLDRYSYRDKVRFPGDSTEYPGGIAFTHDMGVANVFSIPGNSAYEMGGLDDCFSYMSHEQLVNWTLCALVYIEKSGDTHWLEKRLPILIECFESMINRDHPDPEKRNGVMGLDSSRTRGGAEITTYDSLDVSLGQARNNIYLAGKTWAVYVALERLFLLQGRSELSKQAGEQAEKCAFTLQSHVNEKGFIPAVLDGVNQSAIIPAIEGLVFPLFTGCSDALEPQGRFAGYLSALRKHFDTVLMKGICLFDDGGWKLSSTAINSWLSKIYIGQFVAREIFGIQTPDCKEHADKAHVSWLTHPEYSYWSWSDQVHAGIIRGSRYYPRGVTAILWLDENQARSI